MKKILVISLLFVFNYSFAETITVQNTNDVGTGSLRQAIIDAQVNDTIRFNPIILSNGNDTIKLNSEIAFTNGLVFKGLYNSTDTLFISGQNSVRIFSVDLATSSQKNLMLDSLCLIEGYAQGVRGGALNLINGDSLYVYNSVLKNNFTTTYGGAINVNYPSYLVEIINSTISHNTAQISGGGLNASNTINLINSQLNHNTANSDGGGIWAQLNSPFSITIVNSSVSHNTSQFGGGGGIYSSNRFSTVTINGSNVNNNSAQLRGGAILSFAGSSFPDSVSLSSVIIHNTNMSNNTTNESGGAICSDAAFSWSNPLSGSSVHVTNSNMSNNTASNNGAAIYSICHSTSSVSITGSTIANCVSNSKGGGIYSLSDSSSSIITLLKSTLSDNVAAIDGAAIFSSGLLNSTIVSTNSTLTYNNTTGSNGAAVSSFADSLLSIIDVKSSIVALNSGGNVTNSDTSTITSQGYNIFSNSPAGHLPGIDQINVDSLAINLLPFAFNGGTTQNRMPGAFSVATNMGNPSDISNAQNGVIIGTRDVGASESCISSSRDTVEACGSYTLETDTYNMSGVYYATLENTFSCDSIIELNLTIHPIYQNTLNPVSICPNDSVLIFGDYETTSGLYYDSLFTVHGCDSTLFQELNVELIDNTVSQSGSSLTSNQANASYQWIDCANDHIPISGASNQTYTALTNGIYAVIVMTATCSDTSECIIINSVGIHEIENQNSISIYPNPSNGAESFTITNLKKGAFKIQIIEPEGRIIFNKDFIGKQSLVVDIPDLKAGLKLIRVTQEDGTVQTIKYVYL